MNCSVGDSAGNVSGLNLDGNINTGGEIELLQLIHGAGGGIDDVEKPLVSADFELFGGLLVNVDGTVHGELFDPGRERHGAGDAGSGAFGGVHDLGHAAIESAEIIGPEADADALVLQLAWHAEQVLGKSPACPMMGL